MTMEKSDWVDRIVSDLSDFSSNLLDVGLSNHKLIIKSRHQYSPAAFSLKKINYVINKVPLMIKELESDESRSSIDFTYSNTPKMAQASRRPSDYAMINEKAIPIKWIKSNHLIVKRLDALRWLLGLMSAFSEELDQYIAKLRKQVEEARLIRAGESIYAQSDMEVLDDMLENVKAIQRRMESCKNMIRRETDRYIRPSKIPPNPFPLSPTWQVFRRYINALHDPRVYLSEWVNQLFMDPIAVADIPFLYQRWVGLQILNSAERLGWKSSGNIVGSLFLGGGIEFSQGDVKVYMWVDPRLSSHQSGLIGWKPLNKGHELTPDFVFVSGYPGNRDAFILDATLSTTKETAEDKGKYRYQLVGDDLQMVAGVPTIKQPLRSWAACPAPSNYCQLLDQHGFKGIIPVNPSQNNFSALDAWMSDLFIHAKVKHITTDIGP